MKMIEEDNDVFQNFWRDKYICPVAECYLIPEILKIDSDTGKISLKCKKGHFCELDVLAYLKILDEEKDIYPENSNSNNQDSKNVFLFSYRDILLEKEREISSIIETNKLYLNSQEIFPKNTIYNKNLINLGKFIEEENNVQKDIDDIIKEKIEDNKKREKEAIQKLKDEFQVLLDGRCQQENLSLTLKGLNDENKYKWLRNEGFKLISQIRFTNLIVINLAHNEISDITPLNDMLLPHLEIINFSDNKIIDILPIANLLSDKLSEIYLQNNKIDDLGPFLNSNFPLLKIFRVDGNYNAINNINFKSIIKKYNDIIFYEDKKFDDFIKKYPNNNLKKYIIENKIKDEDYLKITKLDLVSNRNPEILKDLFSLIKYPNCIRYLILDDNHIQDAFLLNRMPLYNLEVLDLSLNLITNIKFLKKFSERCRHLKTLYLNDNKINDISPLISYKDGKQIIFEELEMLTLKKNCLDLKDKTTKDILHILLEYKNLCIDYEKKDFE